MRLLIRLWMLSLGVGLAGTLHAQSMIALEYWEFNDAAGKTFNTGTNNGMVNSGVNGTNWNHGGTGGSMQTDGNGNFVISGHSGQTFRSLPDAGYATPYSTGKYRLETNFNSWNLDNSANVNMGMELVNANNERVVSFTLGVDTNDNTKGKIQFAGISEASGRPDKLAYGNKEVGLSNTGAFVVAIEFDFDNDTLDFFADGELVRSITDFNATEFSQLKFFTNSNWNAGSTVSLDSMGLILIPEPETYALLLGLLSLATLVLRRVRRPE